MGKTREIFHGVWRIHGIPCKVLQGISIEYSRTAFTDFLCM